MLAVVPGGGATEHILFVVDSTTTVAHSVAVEQFVVGTRQWYADTVAITGDGREVADKDESVIRVFAATLE